MADNLAVEAVVSVLVIDLEGLTCIDATASSFTKAGCSISSKRVRELSETIGLRVGGLDKMIRGRITKVMDHHAHVSFIFEDKASQEKRKEPRREVRIRARVSDLSGSQMIPCDIVDASKSGCRLDARDLDSLPDEILLHIKKLGLPANGRIVWRAPGCAGVKLDWQFSNRSDIKNADLTKKTSAAGKNKIKTSARLAEAAKAGKARDGAFGLRR
ncbi:PilZ domain-containing protein [Roseibium algae]|uniref:PilZ domain-containing protein n=1 Tax=Roseibium algae TaxID=3123038 RepID=A0ABU8TH44_9HYPH